MEYAPVIIPTLCRYEHFKKCLESLEKCKGAERTDVFIALDHPTKEEHLEGYKKIKEFLYSRNFAFRSFNIEERPYNYGFGEHGNGRMMYLEVSKSYDRYISFDDDCVFSLNFLEYINKGLEKYKDDPNVFAICGYTQPYNFDFGKASYCHHHTDFCTWVYGSWIYKKEQALSDLRNGFLRKNFNLHNIRKLYKCGLYRLLDFFIYASKGKLSSFPDCAQTCYMIIKDYTVVIPSVSKVRKIGWDSEGTSKLNLADKRIEFIANRHKWQFIDQDPEFEYVGDPWEKYEYNNNIARDECEAKLNWGKFIKRLFIVLGMSVRNEIIKIDSKIVKNTRLYG